MARKRPPSMQGQIADVRVIGVDDLLAAFRALGSSAEIRKACEAAIRPAAVMMARAIRQRAPKKTGALKRSIKVSKRANMGWSDNWSATTRRLPAKMFIGIDASVDRGYKVGPGLIKRGKKKGRSRRGFTEVNTVAMRAAVLEFGSPHIRAVGMFRGGYDANKVRAQAMIADGIRPAIAKIAHQAARRRARRAARVGLTDLTS